ncbi:LysE family translocator [Aquimarina sp. RZ0]|uniref:LysE family translocator n=1 Tax=Aquimarina sp. RZ0 TaxID=2607730 RepID=UPI0011F366DB|nr:LysE family transporter [Aquimarina sp. RZ0]KAA1244013.1 lysine transporter LysE [Aquimarina sp. RZ0]
MAFIEGFGIGLGMIIFVGPVFFLLLNSSLQYGVKAGVSVALGIIISDLVCAVLCYYGLSSFMIASQNQFWIGIVGSLILVALGFYYLFKKVKIINEIATSSSAISTFFIKGFSVNFFNPFVFIVWIWIFKYGQTKYDEPGLLGVFIGSVLLGILITDLFKVFLSKKVKKLVSENKLLIFFKITGVVLLVFAVRVLSAVL